MEKISFKNLQVKIGINSGTVISGVVGSRKPQYALFGDTVKIHSKRVGKIQNTLETGGKDIKYTQNGWERYKIHSKRVGKI